MQAAIAMMQKTTLMNQAALDQAALVPAREPEAADAVGRFHGRR